MENISDQRHPSSPAWKVEQLTAGYDGKVILHNVSLSATEGKILVIAGPNGAGKSTLIKASLELTNIETGDVTFFSQKLKKVRKRIAYVPQRSSVDWDFPASVEDVVMMGRYPHRGRYGRISKEDRAVVEASLEQTGMISFRKRQIALLSGGQQQRVFIARALAQEADLYLLDEPFAGIDMTTEEALLELILRMRDEGKTFVVVHHDLYTVREFSDELVLLNGTVIASGSPQTVMTDELLRKTYNTHTTLLVPKPSSEPISPILPTV